MLVGRRSECEALARVVAAARGRRGEARRGEAIVLRSEAGIGKTAMLAFEP